MILLMCDINDINVWNENILLLLMKILLLILMKYY